MADSLSLAMLVLLESLSPEQRAALLLHDVFDYGYPEVAAQKPRSAGAWRAGKPLDPGLFTERSGSIGDWDHDRELDRSAAARVAAGSTGAVRGQTAIDVGRPPAVERVVSAAEQVDEGHG